MRVVLVSEMGGPEVLTVADYPEPVPGPGQVLVDVAAAGVNFSDIYAREGRPPYRRELPFVLGSEGAGTVAALGAGPDWRPVTGSPGPVPRAATPSGRLSPPRPWSSSRTGWTRWSPRPP